MWDYETGQELDVLKDHTGLISSLAFSPCGRFLVSGSDDKTIKLWDFLLPIKAQKSLIEHLLYLCLNPSEEDIKDLLEFKQEIHKLPTAMRPQVQNIVTAIIEKTGKQSKLIELSSDNKPESKDIEIKY